MCYTVLDHKDMVFAPVFRCAVFFSSGIPADLWALITGRTQLMSAETDRVMIKEPTAHKCRWGKNNRLYPTFGPVLSDMCEKETLSEGGHEVPGRRDPMTLTGAPNAPDYDEGRN